MSVPTHHRSPLIHLFGWTTIILLLLVTAEGAGWIGLSIIEKHHVGYGEVRRKMLALVPHEAAPDQAVPVPVGFGTQALHPYLGFAMVPLGPSTVTVGGNDELEAYGFGNNAGPLMRVKAPDQVVVGIFGGSVAFEFARNQGAMDVLKAALRRLPKFHGKEILIDSAGYYGYKQPQHLLALNYLLSLGAQFDVVISLDGFNEVAIARTDVANEAGTYLHFPDHWFARLQSLEDDTEFRSILGQASYLKDRRKNVARLFLRLPPSMFLGTLWKAWDLQAAKAAERAEYAIHNYRPKSAADYGAHGPTLNFSSDDEFYHAIVQMLKRSTLQMDRASKANGASFFHFLQPNQYDTGSKLLTEEEKRDAYAPGHPYEVEIQKGYPLLRAAVTEMQNERIASADLTMIFKNVKESTYKDICCHLNDRGNLLLAEEMAKVITAKFVSGQ